MPTTITKQKYLHSFDPPEPGVCLNMLRKDQLEESLSGVPGEFGAFRDDDVLYGMSERLRIMLLSIPI